MYTAGFSLRLTYHMGQEVGMPADFSLYRNEPDYEQAIYLPAVAEAAPAGGAPAPRKLAVQLSAEGTILIQHLADPGRYASTVVQPAYAAALQLRISWGDLRAHVTGFLRSTPYILHTIPGFSPFWGIPQSVDTRPEIFAAAGVDYHVAGAHVTPGIIVGIQNPASYSAGGTTVVIRDESSRDILPSGESTLPIFSARASLKWDLSAMMSLLIFVQYVHDANMTKLVRDSSGTFRTYQGSDAFGAALVAQARF